jgi:hypothetical protein
MKLLIRLNHAIISNNTFRHKNSNLEPEVTINKSMKTREIKVTISNTGELLVKSPLNLPVGDYDAVLVVNEQSAENPRHFSIEKAQTLLRKYIPATRNIADELIEERRLEALNE